MRKPVFLKELFFVLFFVALAVAALGAPSSAASDFGVQVADNADGS